MDYVGNQRSSLWDDMEAMEDENAKMGDELPSLESEISQLQVQMAEAKRKSRVLACYRSADPESTVSITSLIVNVCGFSLRMLFQPRQWSLN